MGTSYEDQYTFSIISHTILLRMRNFQTDVLEKITTHTVCSRTCFRQSRRLCDNVEKYCRAGQDTDDNMAHAHCMLVT